MERSRIAVAVLEHADPETERTLDELAAAIDATTETVTGAVFDLEADGLVAVREATTEAVSLTPEGEAYAEEGLPEGRLYRAVRDAGDGMAIGDAVDAAGIEGEAVDVALSNFPRKYGTVSDGRIQPDPDADPDADPERAVITELADRSGGADGQAAVDTADLEGADEAVLDRLASRGLIERRDRTERLVRLTEAGVAALEEGIAVREGTGAVTPDLLTSGAWRETAFRSYDVTADAEAFDGGKTHVLRQTAERVKDVLVGMGFEEMQGPHVDAQFWINDCLFMPQDHPARTHWDQFALESPDTIADLPDDLVERVRDAHLNGVGEDGDGYHSPWEESVARDLDLRGHTTSLSMRYLAGVAEGDLDPPERRFSVEKVYRNDTLDPTHLLEFFQIEGWVLADELSVRDLMGTFEAFYAEFGIHDLEFKPHYNPYTEPSFELFGRHPETDELIEIGNSGLFRDEVLEPLGVEGDVMAWGLALERLLMLMYGFDDIRDVHGTLCDLDLLRSTEVVY